MLPEQPQQDLAQHPDISTDKLILYVKKASPTSTANTVKPLMLIEALSIPHTVHIVTSTKNETWFHDINPYKMVPAMEDVVDDTTKRSVNVFDSSACLQYIVDKYDDEGLFSGKNLWEKTMVNNWLMAYTAGLGATGKWWLMLKIPRPIAIGDSMQVFVNAIKDEYSVLEKRLNEPRQDYIALPDRPTTADFATLPLANADIAATADIDFSQWPKLMEWTRRMYALPYVARAIERVNSFGVIQ